VLYEDAHLIVLNKAGRAEPCTQPGQTADGNLVQRTAAPLPRPAGIGGEGRRRGFVAPARQGPPGWHRRLAKKPGSPGETSRLQIQKRIRFSGLPGRKPWVPRRRAARSRHRSAATRWIAKKYAVDRARGRAARPAPQWQAGANGLGGLLANALQKLDHPAAPHQIRVHCAHLAVTRISCGRCPPDAAAASCDLPHWPRPCIALRLGLDHPISGEAAGVRGPPAADLRKSCCGELRRAESISQRCCAPLFCGRSRSEDVSRLEQIGHGDAVKHREKRFAAAGIVPAQSKLSRIAVSRCTASGRRGRRHHRRTPAWWGRNRTATSRALAPGFLGRRRHPPGAGRGICRRGASAKRRPLAVAPHRLWHQQHQQTTLKRGWFQPAGHPKSRVCRRCRRRQAARPASRSAGPAAGQQLQEGSRSREEPLAHRKDPTLIKHRQESASHTKGQARKGADRGGGTFIENGWDNWITGPSSLKPEGPLPGTASSACQPQVAKAGKVAAALMADGRRV